MTYFSIVIAVFNKEKYIADTLKSILKQTYQNFEIVILNDGSTDKSEEAILKFNDSRIRYFSQKNQGASAARNTVIAKAKHEYIALLDADDYWHPFYLEEQKKSIESFPNQYVYATATQKRINGKEFECPYSIPQTKENPILINYFEGSHLTSLLHSSSTVIHKEVFEKSGMYNPAIKSGEDIDLYVRIGLDYKIVFSKRICVAYVIRENSLISTIKNLDDIANFEAYEIYEKDNPALKKFLDLNRYSLCVLAKTEGDTSAFEKNLKKIDLWNLSTKQRFLLKQNKTVLKYLLQTKNNLEKLGLQLTTFK